MAVIRGFTMLAVAVLACIAASPALAVTRSPDGRPRPEGYPDTPTMGYGATPPCYLNSAPVTCEWYGFAHTLYPTLGAECLTYTRRVLSNTTIAPPGDLVPYLYYYLDRFVFDTTTNTSYCLYGCFNMGAGSPAASPAPSGFAPPPLTIGTPPPATIDTPPPATIDTPPPAIVDTPPPAVLSPADSAPPPTLTPDATPPPTPPAPATPPPPPGTRVINFNGAAFLRPTGLVSLFFSGALLVLNGVVTF